MLISSIKIKQTTISGLNSKKKKLNKIMELIVSTLSENPYFSAGFGLFGVGAVAAGGRKLTNAGLVLFRRHCITTLGINC